MSARIIRPGKPAAVKEHAPGFRRRSVSYGYSVREGAAQALAHLAAVCQHELSDADVERLERVAFTAPCHSRADLPLFPCPLKEQEATAAIRALEGSTASAIADLRYGAEARVISVDVTRVGSFLMSTYMTSIDDLSKGDPKISHRIPG
jgi:hypothetical protein